MRCLLAIFYFPDRESLIHDMYLDCVRGHASFESLRDSLSTKRFTRDQLSAKALKGNHHTDRFFQDVRGRVFPPDAFHAPSRYADTPKEGHTEEPEDGEVTGTMQVLNRRYRFGVTARDGNLHYDVQYETPKDLQKESMYCARMGSVLVTGSHANVGVNDVIWVPDGKKESARTF